MEWSLLDGRVEHSGALRLMWQLRSIILFYFILLLLLLFCFALHCIVLHMFDVSVRGRNHYSENHYSNPRQNYAGATEGRRHTDACKKKVRKRVKCPATTGRADALRYSLGFVFRLHETRILSLGMHFVCVCVCVFLNNCLLLTKEKCVMF
jgi:hypothetical protein